MAQGESAKKQRRSKAPKGAQSFLGELILIGGEIMACGEAAAQLEAEGVHRGAVDWCVYGAKALTEQELLSFARNGLVLALRLQAMKCMEDGNGNNTNEEEHDERWEVVDKTEKLHKRCVDGLDL